MKVRRHVIRGTIFSAAIAVLGIPVLASCSGDDHPGVLLGAYDLTAQAKIGPCSGTNPSKEWTTTLTVSASMENDRVWFTEAAYGCTLLASLRGSTLDAAGLSCPVSVAGFFREDFTEFLWDFISKSVTFASTLYGQDANNVVGTYCAEVAGSTTMQ